MIEDNKKIVEMDEENIEDENPEKLEEKKLMSKYPQAATAGGKNALPTSQFFQKRLQQRKFFDSGDYNMAKAKGLKLPVTPKTPVTSTPGQPAALSVLTAEQSDGSTSPTGVEIPTPDTVPHRKTSLVQSTASKLSPQPLYHLHSPTGDQPMTVLDAAS